MGSYEDFLKENAADPEQASAPVPSESAGFSEGLKRGLANMIGSVGDLPASLYQGAKAEAGFIGHRLGLPAEYMPEVNIPVTRVFRDYLASKMANPELKPKGAAQKIALGIGEGVGGSLYPAGLVKAPAESGAKALITAASKDIGKNALFGAMAGGGAAAGGAMSGGNPLAELAGGLAGPAAYIALSPTLAALRASKAAVDAMAGKTAEGAPAAAGKYMTGRIVGAAAGNPEAVSNADDALRIARQMGPEWKPSIGEMTNTRALLDLESKFSTTSPQTLNREAARRASNEAAVRAAYERVAPQVERGDVATNIRRAINAEQSAIDQGLERATTQVPSASQSQVGRNILEAARAEKKTVQEKVITPAYEAAFAAAGDAKTSIDNVIASAQAILGETLSKVKPDVAPNTISAIKQLQARAGSAGPVASEATLARIPGLARGAVNVKRPPTEATLKEIDALHKAINADVSTALSSGDPAAAMRARNLMRMHDAVDEAITGGKLPDAAKKAYATALETWKTAFKPRFKEGVNADLFRGSRKNEPSAIRLDEITGKYFKPGGEVEAEQFAKLAGKNPTLAGQFQNGVMDIYRSEVMNPQTGVLDVTKHNAFMQRYEKPLSVLSENGFGVRRQLQDIGSSLSDLATKQAQLKEIAGRIGYESTDELVSAVLGSRKAAYNASRILNEGERKNLTRAVMDRVWDTANTNQGINARAMSDYIYRNKNGIMDALTASEGRQAAAAHLTALEDISKAADIATRGKALGGLSGFSDDPMKAATGISLSTVMSQARGVQMGRTSVPVAASMMAGPVLKKLGMEKFDELMYGAMHDEGIARNLAGLLQAKSELDAQRFGGRLLTMWRDNKTAIMAGLKSFSYKAAGVEQIKSNAIRAVPPTLQQIGTDQQAQQ